MNSPEPTLIKRKTGLPGLDEITGGGLPTAGTTLIIGQAGAGKSVFCLQILAKTITTGAGAIYVSFEESKAQIHRNATSFNWGKTLISSDNWDVIDARPAHDATAAGGFDLKGLLAAISSRAKKINAGWIVFDGIDRLLRLQPDINSAVAQIAAINNWCEEQQLSLLLTAKQFAADTTLIAYLEDVEYILDTVLNISQALVDRRLNRRFRIAKYRGSAHVTDELPMVMDNNGLHIPFADRATRAPEPVSHERLQTGIPRLDDVLTGGLYRGSTTLVSDQPGTAKSTLGASFALAAAGRNERTLYISFDELADRIVRNVASVGIDLESPVKAGLVKIVSREAWRSLVEVHFIEILRMLDEFKPGCLVIDPISALLKSTSPEGAYITIERLLGTARARGITTMLTSLTEHRRESESTLSHTSTLADTWIALGYDIRGGERNRTLSVVKSRGTGHSNQVRELVLSANGIDLADVYQFGSEVLMGTARLQKEQEQASFERKRSVDRIKHQQKLEHEIELAKAREKKATAETQSLEEELRLEKQGFADTDSEESKLHGDILQKRDKGSRATFKPTTPEPNNTGGIK